MYFAWAFDFASKPNVNLDLENYIVVNIIKLNISPLSHSLRLMLSLQPGLEFAPKPFVCDVKVRDGEREKIIRAMYAAGKD
jgi:hypothetical protein